MVGELLKLPTWVIGTSPYTHVPKLPAEPMTWTGTLVMVGVAGAIGVASWALYRRRDLG